MRPSHSGKQPARSRLPWVVVLLTLTTACAQLPPVEPERQGVSERIDRLAEELARRLGAPPRKPVETRIEENA